MAGDRQSSDEERRAEFRQTPFPALLRQFQGTIDAARELHSELLPHVRTIEERRLSPEALSIVRSLPEEKRKRLEELGNFLAAAEREAAEAQDSGDDEGANAVAEASGGADQVLGAEKLEASVPPEFAVVQVGAIPPTPVPVQVIDALRRVFGEDVNAVLEYVIRRNREAMSPNRIELLRGSLLTMSVSALEVLLGGIAAQRFECHPGALGSAKEFSLTDLESFATIADARDRLIEDKVGDFLRGSYEDWKRWFKDESSLQLNFETLAINEARVSEIFQRRHIVVHNSGKVSTRYLQRVPSSESSVGDKLAIDAAYLDRAIDEIDALGNLLLVGAWSKLLPGEEEMALAELTVRSQDIMSNPGRWLAVRKICSVVKLIEKSPAANRQIAQVNEWLATKRLEGIDAIRDEVRAWDTSASNPVFSLVQMALLDEVDAMFEALPDLLERKVISERQLEVWPVLDELRADPRFEKFASS